VFVLVIIVPVLVFACRRDDTLTLSAHAIKILEVEQTKGAKLKDLPELVALLPDMLPFAFKLKLETTTP